MPESRKKITLPFTFPLAFCVRVIFAFLKSQIALEYSEQNEMRIMLDLVKI